jgi:hypothetical protein
VSWVKIDDRYAHHPKILAAGPLAMALDIAGMCYAAAHETDGRIPTAALALLTPFLTPPKQRAAAAKLVEVGRWETIPGGWQIHDFLAYNPTAADRAAKRDQQADRVRRHRDKKRDGNALQPRPRNAPGNTAPGPHPRPAEGGDGDPPKPPHPQPSGPASPTSATPGGDADSAGQTHPPPTLTSPNGSTGDPPSETGTDPQTGLPPEVIAAFDAALGPNWRRSFPSKTDQNPAEFEAKRKQELARLEALIASETNADEAAP